MTASEDQIAAAAAAVELGEQIAAEYWQSAAQTPGVGLAVSLPSVAGPVGPPQGLNFDLPAEVPALRKPAPAPRLVPDYASEAVGGLGYHSTTPGTPAPFDGVPWPSGRSSSVVHVSPRSRDRVRIAVRATSTRSVPTKTSIPTAPSGSTATSRRGRLRRVWRALRGK